uniref:Failed axon connections homolog (Trinotate prediction) n=1 Tax=Myxobolus squamalis TaxID=59785 RepID=A0A6B2G2L3_MYXSQ
MKLNYRIVQTVKPCENAFIMINKKTFRGSLGIVDLIKNMVGLDLNCAIFHRDAPILRFVTIALETQTDSCLIYHRWVDQLVEWRQASSDFKGIGLFRNMFLESKIHKKIRTRLETIGLTFPTSEQVLCLLVRDFHALSILLGEKNFMFGKCPTSLDCVCFGIISTLLYSQVESNLKKIILSNFSNLLQHCERIRSIYWPDWEKVVCRVRPCSTPRNFFSFRKPKPPIPAVQEVVSTCPECLKKQQSGLRNDKAIISSSNSQEDPQPKVFVRMSHSSSNLMAKECPENEVKKTASLSSQSDCINQIKKECQCKISGDNLKEET